MLRLRNASALPFRLRPRLSPGWLTVEPATLAAEATSLVRARLAADAPPGRHEAVVNLEVSNLNVGPGRTLAVDLPLAVTVAAPSQTSDLRRTP
jgi:hypothetical protein